MESGQAVKIEGLPARREPIIVDKFLRIPEKKGVEFWTAKRIEHIRSLSSTGRAKHLWDPCKYETRRILDYVYFKAEIEDNEKGVALDGSVDARGVEVSSEIAYGQIEMATPFYMGDMSFGALSGIPNIALARTADLTRTLTGTGEGGLHPEVKKSKRITVQWASARFGVNIDVLNTGLGVVIKIGQGAKPGIGGHLPGKKVVDVISTTRRIPVGTDAISPAPHHDIYSIEDLEQRILSLKEATGKPVFVKVGVTNYIAYIASGVARMGADGIIMDGNGAGTGAAPSIVRDNVGLPIELAVPAVDEMLRREGLRDGFTVIAAGRISGAEDAAKLIALGADIASLGTAALIGMGCVMVHKCHQGFCPAVLTNRIEDNPARLLSLEISTRWSVNLVKGITEELKMIMDRLGLRSLEELKGRRDLLIGRNLSQNTLRVLGIEAM